MFFGWHFAQHNPRPSVLTLRRVQSISRFFLFSKKAGNDGLVNARDRELSSLPTPEEEGAQRTIN
jgi:hypothetical protein